MADCVEEVGALAVLGGVRRQARRSLFAIRSASGRAAGPLCQLSEILGGGSQQELVLSTKWTSQPEPIET